MYYVLMSQQQELRSGCLLCLSGEFYVRIVKQTAAALKRVKQHKTLWQRLIMMIVILLPGSAAQDQRHPSEADIQNVEKSAERRSAWQSDEHHVPAERLMRGMIHTTCLNTLYQCAQHTSKYDISWIKYDYCNQRCVSCCCCCCCDKPIRQCLYGGEEPEALKRNSTRFS